MRKKIFTTENIILLIFFLFGLFIVNLLTIAQFLHIYEGDLQKISAIVTILSVILVYILGKKSKD